MNDVDEVMGGCIKVLIKIVAYSIAAWLGSVVWNWGVADYLGIDYFMTASHAFVMMLFGRFFFV